MIPIENVDFFIKLTAIFSFAAGIASKHYADAYFAAKKKLSEIRKVSDFVSQKIAEIDDALQDNKIDNVEFERIFSIKTKQIQVAKAGIQK